MLTRTVRAVASLEPRTSIGSPKFPSLDRNREDETGLPWTYLDQALDPSVVVPGRLLVVGA